MTSPQPPIQPPLDYSDNGPGMIISCSILAFIATVCVALRFWAKRLTRVSWGLDDYLALSALLMHHALFISSCIEVVDGGLGRDIRIVATQNPNAIVILFKSLLVSEIAYGLSSMLVKLSVLAFYRRIFPTRTVKMGCYILGSICILWALSIEIVNFLQCRPLDAFWLLEKQLLPTTKCIDPILFFLGNSIANCCIDFATLALPIHEISKLHASRSTKIGIASVFLLGSIAFAASLLRTISTGILHNEGNTNFTKQFVVSGVATVVEIYAAIIGACLPTLVPVYRKLRYGDPLKSTAKSANSKTYFSANSKNTTGKASDRSKLSNMSSGGSFERLHGDEHVTHDPYPHHHVDVSSWKGNDRTYSHVADIPMEGIVVKSDLSWSTDAGSRV